MNLVDQAVDSKLLDLDGEFLLALTVSRLTASGHGIR